MGLYIFANETKYLFITEISRNNKNRNTYKIRINKDYSRKIYCQPSTKNQRTRSDETRHDTTCNASRATRDKYPTQFRVLLLKS